MSETLKINFFDNVDEIIRKAKRKFGEDKEFAFVEWPDSWPFGSLRLVMIDKKEDKVEEKNKGTGEKDQEVS